jgi:hypothetical protein
MSEEIDISQELNGAFAQDVRLWKGKQLAPYTEGSRVLMSQIRSVQDSGLFFVWSFLFLHIELHKDRKNAIRLCWDKNAFREAVLDFSSEMTVSDRDAAAVMVNKIMDESTAAELEVVPDGKPAPPGNG